MLLETYNGLVSQSRSLNDIHRINIAFGNTMTPQEVVELEESLFVGDYTLPPMRDDRTFSDRELMVAAREWIEQTLTHLKLMRKAEAEPFLRRDVRKSVTLYSDGGDPDDKTLIIALPGANHRLMMPIPSLLQALPADRADVLFIRDGTRSGYRQGLEGLASSIDTLGPAIPRIIDISRYRRLAGLGVSAGGLPSLLLGLQMGSGAVLVCGGGSPNDPRWVRPGQALPADTLRAAAERGIDAKLTIAFGTHSDPDRASARDICACLGIEPLEVSSRSEEVRHNILHPLALDGLLPAFLADRLGL